MSRTDRTWALIGAAACVAFGLVFALSSPKEATPDQLVAALVSVQHLTFWYWGQSRFGMLAPLLTSWISSPVLNLMAQNLITAACLPASLMLTVRLIFRAPVPNCISAGFVATAVYVMVAPAHHLWVSLSTMPYYVGLTLGLAGLLHMRTLMGPRGWLPGFLVMCLGFWVNGGLAIVLAALMLVRRRPDPLSMDWRRWLAIITAQSGAILAEQMHPDGNNYGWLDAGRVCGAMVAGFYALLESGGMATLVLTIATGTISYVAFRRAIEEVSPDAHWTLSSNWRALQVALAAFVITAEVSANAWVSANGWEPRYYMQALSLLCLAPALVLEFEVRSGLWTASVWKADEVDGVAPVLTMIMALSAACWAFGLPVSRSTYLEQVAPMEQARRIAKDSCGGVIGSYGGVWRTVFAALELRRQAGDPRPLYGLTQRADWVPLPIDVVCGVTDNP